MRSIEVEQHLPRLRRLALSLCGSTEQGDRVVATMLETLIADPSLFLEAASTKTELLRLFMTTFWSVTESDAKMLLQSLEGLPEQDADWVVTRS